ANRASRSSGSSYTAKLITEVVTAASATITAAPTLTTTPSATRRRKGVDEAYARELEAELNKKINWDDVIDQVQRKKKEDNAVMRYQALKRKPQTEAQARKNMMIYLRNMVGFKMDYFKGMKYDEIRPIFEKYFNSNVAFLENTKEQMEEEDSRALKRIMPNDEDDVYTEATPLTRKVLLVDYKIYTENNKPYHKIIRADGFPQLFLSFLSLLRNIDKEDLELFKLKYERSKNSSWISKGQKLETVRVIWSAHYHIYFYTDDLAGREKISTFKVHSGSNAQQWLQVKQKDDGIFISQDKYVADKLKKFDFTTVKTARTPIEPNKTLIKDVEAEDVDVHLYRLMIRSLMYLTAFRPDIIFFVCACVRFQVTPKTSHLYVVKIIFRYLKGQPKLSLWYPRDSPFDLEAFSDSDYAAASLDRKSTIGGCQFLGKRLIL
nr:uncharacterized mitochondrial protein AtMg00810-like [Tanacetum cinerariifolium]